jgi:hypothetical protein
MIYATNPAAKIRILSDIFTIFASWRNINITVIKRFIKIFWHTFVAIATFLFAVALIIQLPQVQTFVTGKVVEKISAKLDGDIVFEKIHLKPFTTLVLKNAVIIDRNPATDPLKPEKEKTDTFFRAEYIIAKFTIDGLFRNQGIHLDKAFINNACMNLVIEDKEDAGDGDTSTDNLSRIFRLKKPEVPRRSEKEIFRIRDVEIRNMQFTMNSCRAERNVFEGGIDWYDMDVTDIDLSASDLQFKAGIMSGDLESLSFIEKSGYRMESLTGSAKVGRGRAIINDLHIDDPWSDVRLPLFMMSYRNAKAFSNYIEEVKMDGEIDRSRLDFTTISYFAPQLEGNGLIAEVSGSMSGYVNDFSFTDIAIDMEGGQFSGVASGRITGLPDINRTSIAADLDNFRITSDGLSTFLNEWTKEGGLDLSRFAKGVTFTVNAEGSGPMNDMEIEASVTSDSGDLDADVRISDILKKDKPIGISGIVHTKDLDLGDIIGAEILGPATLKTGLRAHIGSGDMPSDVRFDSLMVHRLNIKDYDYTNIAAVGDISSNSFDGRIICNDPNLNFMFQGIFALSAKTQNARYKFFANVGHADLNAMNLDKRGISRVDLRASADFTKTGKGDLMGKIDIADLMLENNLGRHDIGDISLTSYSNDNTFTVRLDSQFANGKYTGSAPVTTFISDLQNVTIKKELPSLFNDASYTWNGNSYNLSFRCSNSMDLLTFVMPGLYIDAGTSITASLSDKGIFKAGIQSNRLAFGKNYLKGLEATFGNADERLGGNLECDEMRLASAYINDNTLNLHADDDHIGVKFSYDNHSELLNMGEFILNGDLSREDESPVLDLNVLPSSVYLNSKEWEFMPSHLTVMTDGLDVESFTLASGEEQIKLFGKTSKEKADTLTLNLDRFDISILNSLTSSDIGIRGAATGKVDLISPMTSKGILADMLCDSMYIADVPLGVLSLGSRWNEEEQNFELFARNELDGQSNIDIEGKLSPKDKALDATLSMNRLKVDYAQPFLADVFSEMSGQISGTITLDGPISNINIASEDTRLENSLLRIEYTDVPYYADGPFHIDNSGVYFDTISIKDRFNGTGSVTGSINWDHFRDLSFNTHIRINEIEGINLDERAGEDFYGQVFGTGNVSITGPMNSIVLNVDAVTAKSGQLHIPLSSSATAGKVTNLLRFKQEEVAVKIDPYEAMMTRLEATENADNDFTVKLRVNAHPEVEAFVEIDKASGNVLSGRGSGLIELEVGTDLFNINGDYTLNSGNYKFVAMGLVSRDFQIQDGSSIRFNGDIMESTLNIDAIYQTKASISTLLSDLNSVSTKRTVNCGISITDKLSNPRLSFSISIPDLNPTVKSRVESALSTEDKVQKQFLSLIVSNSFLPDEQSGIVNNSTVLYSNVSEMLANQLNNIFQKLDIPLDLGVNYQPNESGNDLFDVAVSTQLFNNRVVVNGNIGNRQYNTTSTQNDVVGDLDIEIKLDRSGAFRVNLFSHSADQFSNYLDNSQRNGVGLMYQTEFNTMKAFIRNMFLSKKKRQEAKMKEEQEMLEGGTVQLRIEAPEKKEKQENKNE